MCPVESSAVTIYEADFISVRRQSDNPPPLWSSRWRSILLTLKTPWSSSVKPKETLIPCKSRWTLLFKLTFIICQGKKTFPDFSVFFAQSWSFSWRRNGKYFNVARDAQTSMRRRSGTLDIYAWNDPEQYEAEYQCIASNEYGSAYSHKIRLRLYSKFVPGRFTVTLVWAVTPSTRH